jgi:hypothetical protein
MVVCGGASLAVWLYVWMLAENWMSKHPNCDGGTLNGGTLNGGTLNGGTLNTWRSGDDGRTVAERLQVRF